MDDATHEAVAIVPAHSISGHQVVRILERLGSYRGLPRIIRTDNGKEFCGKAMLIWAHERGLALRLIEPGKPNQNAYGPHRRDWRFALRYTDWQCKRGGELRYVGKTPIIPDPARWSGPTQ